MKLWKSPAELEGDPPFLDDEFPFRAAPGMDRREFLRIMGASLALAGLTGCRGAFLPQRKLAPYVEQPEEMLLGESLRFRTATSHHGYGFGVEVASRDGRPIKIEGNPDHPASLGACDATTMASILEFYDPDRSQAVIHRGEEATWEEFFDSWRPHLAEGLTLLTGTVTSPTTHRLISELRAAHPNVRWHCYESVNRDNLYEGNRMALGRPLAPIFDLAKARVILAIDFDLHESAWGRFAFARALMDGRGRNRIYSAQTMPTLTSVVADHSRPMPPSEIVRLAEQILSGEGDAWTHAVATDLEANRGAAIVVAGEHLPPEVHAAVAALNARLGAPVSYIDPPEASYQPKNLRSLIDEIDRGEVNALLIASPNPAYQSMEFAERLGGLPHTAFLGLYPDETATQCHWALPESHFLEGWGDVRTFDGSASIVQPLIDPIHDSRSLDRVLAGLLGKDAVDDGLVRETWREKLPSETSWRDAVRTGVVPDTAHAELRPSVAGVPTSQAVVGFQVVVLPDPHIGDGAHGNNAWLQETGKPHSGITWENAVHLSPRTAQRLGVETGQYVRVSVGARAVDGPVSITPGHADECATVHFGYGRTTGSVAKGLGFNAFVVADRPGFYEGEIQPLQKRIEFANVQRFHRFEGRDIIHEVAVGAALEKEDLDSGPTLYQETNEQERELPRPQWGMSIDLDRCIGCNACVTACQAENNVSVVGRENVVLGREMHWIRVDRYYAGDEVENPRTYFQPVPCMHCETAPCEPVCPVAATVHSHEGLNQMIYNRCVGTRYCSNNCPYKVRRFNFLDYQTEQPNFQGWDPLESTCRHASLSIL